MKRLAFFFLLTNSIIANFILANQSYSKSNKLLVVSFDGIRADKFDEFLHHHPESNFNYFIQNGVKAEYMEPSFPALTFPNHQTLVTGLFSESHGIIGNFFHDPETHAFANLIFGDNAHDIQWWNLSEPVWMTASNQGLKTGASLWPGTEVLTRTPDVFTRSAPRIDFYDRVDEFTHWMHKFDLDLTFAYFSEPDSCGHTHGPSSPEYLNMIRDMDDVFGYILDRLNEFNLLETTNIILLSDHGMIDQINEPYLVTNYVPPNLINFNNSVFTYVSNIYPIRESQKEELFKSLQKIPNTKVYYKEELPESFHYSHNERIAPIVAISDEGYSLTDDPEYKGMVGIHGFNNSIPSMRTIFIASGPDFHKNQIMNPFSNINVYSLICDLISIKCHSNNGTSDIFSSYLTHNNHNHFTTTNKSSKLSFSTFFDLTKLFLVIICSHLTLKI